MSETKKFRKKPVVIEAYQTDTEIDIETLEGTMHANVGDWIITGVNGEKYPCKPDIFKKTYEPAEEGIMQDLKQESKWIPVTARLPDAEDHYLAAYKLANGEAFCDILYYGFMDFKADEGMCFYKYDSEWGDVKYDGVTHWMRMPEIPKEEDDADK